MSSGSGSGLTSLFNLLPLYIVALFNDYADKYTFKEKSGVFCTANLSSGKRGMCTHSKRLCLCVALQAGVWTIAFPNPCNYLVK